MTNPNKPLKGMSKAISTASKGSQGCEVQTKRTQIPPAPVVISLACANKAVRGTMEVQAPHQWLSPLHVQTHLFARGTKRAQNTTPRNGSLSCMYMHTMSAGGTMKEYITWPTSYGGQR